MKKIKLLSWLLALMMILTMAPVTLAAVDSGYATRGQIVELLLVAADDYNPGLSRDDIIKGDEGGLREEDHVTRAEAFVMISRAFGPLDAPTGHNARMTVTDLNFDDVQDWAKEDVANLISGGVLVGTGDGVLSPNDYVTTEQVQTVITRIWTLKGEKLQDSFFATANKELLDTLVIKPGELSAGTFNSLQTVASDRVTEIIKETLIGDRAEGSKEQKIRDFYLSVLDVEGRNEVGNAPIQAYLDDIAAFTSLEDYITLRSKVLKETGASMLLYFTPSIDAKDSTKYTMYFGSVAGPMLPKDYYEDMESPVMVLYEDYLKTIYKLMGLEETEAAANAQAYLALEAALAESQMETQDYSNIDLVYNPYTMNALQALFPSIDLNAILVGDGYRTESQYIVRDPGQLKVFASILENAGPEALKAYARMDLMQFFSSTLSEDYTKAGTEFSSQLYGTEGERSDEETAAAYTQSVLSDYLGEVYIDRHFSPEAKADVEEMVDEFLDVYRERIGNLTWMSDETKTMALRKLDTMTVKIGYPDEWGSDYDNVTIKGPKDGGSFYSNICALTLAEHAASIKLQGSEVDKSAWLLSVYTVNAYYNFTANEIVFPAGILQAPFYDIEASREENLGGIGFVIAHEITHSFDNNGAKYDENGNAANWWTEGDYEKFNELCQQVIAFYDGLEYAPGIQNNGTLTLSENIADLGAIACVIQAAQKMEDPDYEKIFLNLAACWVQTSSREMLYMLSVMDVHSANSIRTDRTAQSVDQFYETFDIQPGDGMYLAPEKRISIW